MIKKIFKILGIIILLLIFGILYFFWSDANLNKYDVAIEENKIPVFTQVDFPFTHKYDSKKSLPIAPSAMIDINNDGIEEVFMGGGLNQDDEILAFRDGNFVKITSETNYPSKGNFTSSGVAVADFDDNGFLDLIIGREDGLHLYYNNNGIFIHKAIETPINEKSSPAGITVGDINKDGHLDIFLSTYIKKELMTGQTKFEDYSYGATSALLINDGNNNFSNQTVAAGLDYIHNTFMAILVDIDNDSHLDLVVAHDTGEVRTYKNNGNETFKLIKNPLTNKFAYPMGIAAGDYNNDGLIDFMFSNTGSTLPRLLAIGDIKDASKFNEKWILFRNDGDFKFTEVADEAKIADYEFSWGAVFADMNNDGLQDLLVAENYVDLAPNKLFRLPSRMLIQKEDHTFVPTEKKSGVVNPNYAITPLVSDFNNDGYLDFIWTNINTPSLAYVNQGGTNNFINILLPKNAKTLGAKIEIITPNKKLYEWLLTGEGLAGDQTNSIHFGLGTEKEVKTLIITFIDGRKILIENPEINTEIKIDITEEVTPDFSEEIE